jgi:hypothetical protein
LSVKGKHERALAGRVRGERRLPGDSSKASHQPIAIIAGHTRTSSGFTVATNFARPLHAATSLPR